MDEDGNARKRQRRNAIRPNSLEAQAIRAIADEYTTRTAVEAVENLHILEDTEEIIIAQMHLGSSIICTTHNPSVAIAAPCAVISSPNQSPIEITTSTVQHIFPAINEIPLAECRHSNELDDILSFHGSAVAVATAVPVDEVALCVVDDILLNEVESDVDELCDHVQLESIAEEEGKEDQLHQLN